MYGMFEAVFSQTGYGFVRPNQAASIIWTSYWRERDLERLPITPTYFSASQSSSAITDPARDKAMAGKEKWA